MLDTNIRRAHALFAVLSLTTLASGCSLVNDFGGFTFEDAAVGTDASVEDDAGPPVDAGMDAGTDAGMPDATMPDGGADAGPGFCLEDQRVQDGVCVSCPANGARAAGDPTDGGDTACTCNPGTTGDGITACAPTLCDSGQRVQDNTCVSCPANSSNPSGADASGDDTACTCDAGFGGDGVTECRVGACNPDFRVSSGSCVACPANSTNAGGDDTAGVDTDCDCNLGTTGDGRTMCTPVLCAAGERVQDHVCVDCPANSTNAADDDASGDNTACDCDPGTAGEGTTAACMPVVCMVNQRVQDNACVACPGRSGNVAGDDASGGNTTCMCDPGTTGDGFSAACTPISCAANRRVAGNMCVDCPANSTNAAGDDASGPDTACDCNPGSTPSGSTCTPISCPANRRVQDNACVMCPANSTNDAGDEATGANTECDCIAGTAGDGVTRCDPVCGDGMTVGGEACDDGNVVTETECPYGTPSCVRCNASCTSSLTLTGGFCGDGARQTAFEACDDGTNVGAKVGQCVACRGETQRVLRIVTSGGATTTGKIEGGSTPAQAADTMCEPLGNYRALFADGLSRRATGRPYTGDDQADWVLYAFTAYYNDAGEHIWTTDASRLLGVRDRAPRALLARVGGTNPAWTGMAADHTVLPPEQSCERWTSDSRERDGFSGNSGYFDDRFLQFASFPCDREWRVMCVEQP